MANQIFSLQEKGEKVLKIYIKCFLFLNLKSFKKITQSSIVLF